MRCNKMILPDDVCYIEISADKTVTIYDIGTTNNKENVLLHLDENNHVIGVELADYGTGYCKTKEIV